MNFCRVKLGSIEGTNRNNCYLIKHIPTAVSQPFQAKESLPVSVENPEMLYHFKACQSNFSFIVKYMSIHLDLRDLILNLLPFTKLQTP
jgi:hypothetical protein